MRSVSTPSSPAPSWGGQSYAPRRAGTLALPTDPKLYDAAATGYVAAGNEPSPTSVEGTLIAATESLVPTEASGPGGSAMAAPRPAAPRRGHRDRGSSTPAPGGGQTTAGTVAPTISTWPPSTCSTVAGRTDASTGRSFPSAQCRYTTRAASSPRTDTRTRSSPRTRASRDASRSSGRSPRPVVAAQGTPVRIGSLAERAPGRGRWSAELFYGSPIVAWRPAPGQRRIRSSGHERSTPWRSARRLDVTAGTSVSLPLKSGSYWYRVRGVDPAMPTGRQFMTWSTPLSITVAQPKFRLVASSK